MTRWLPHPILVVVMILVWALLLDSFAFGVVLLGAALSMLIAAWTSAFWPDRPRLQRPVTLLRFVAVILWDIIIANIAVARLVLGPQNRLNPRFLEIPLDVADPYALVTLASVITLTPGTVSSELSADRRTLYVHALDATDPAAAVRQIKQRYEAPLKEIFE
jgi:multicomponent K+:H+ antiporter subunit E